MGIEDIPESETPTLAPLPFASLLARIEQRRATGAFEPESEPEPAEEYMPHARFEAQMAESQHRGYADPTGCDGMLRIEDQSGATWMVVCDACGFEVGLAMRKIDPGRVIEQQLAKVGLPEHFVGKPFDQDDPEQRDTLAACARWTRDFKPNKLADAVPGIMLYGKAGVGKSHLLSYVVETLVKRHQLNALFRSYVTLMDELRAGIDSAQFEVRWNHALRVPLLAVDDLGATRSTPWRHERLFALVDARIERQLPTLVATNVPPAGWERAFGDRTASRLRGLCVRLELRGRDRRSDGVQESLLDSEAEAA